LRYPDLLARILASRGALACTKEAGDAAMADGRTTIPVNFETSAVADGEIDFVRK